MDQPVLSACHPDYYFDGVFDKCIPCVDVCRANLPRLFCCNNCPAYCTTTPTSLPPSSSTELILDVTTTNTAGIEPENFFTFGSQSFIGLLAVCMVLFIALLTVVVVASFKCHKRRSTTGNQHQNCHFIAVNGPTFVHIEDSDSRSSTSSMECKDHSSEFDEAECHYNNGTTGDHNKKVTANKFDSVTSIPMLKN